MALDSGLSQRYPRLIIAVVLGSSVGIFSSGEWQVRHTSFSRMECHCVVVLILMAQLIRQTTPAQVKSIAEQKDGNGAVFTIVLTVAAVLGLAAIIFELAGAKDLSGGLKYVHYASTAATVFGSWLLIAMVYTIHYAHCFYRSKEEARAPKIPNEDEVPNYWGFLYFSITISVAAQTSDINVMTTDMRKVVTIQSVLSFIFNVAIVRLSINIAAGLIGG